MGESENKTTEVDLFTRVAVAVIAFCFFGFFISLFLVRDPGPSRLNTCINNMRRIDVAISEWALENGKTNGTIVTANDITNYIKLNRYGKIPLCPSGGKYIFGKVGVPPQITCSLSTANPPHKLP